MRAKLGRPNLVLADYFDFCCGTSTGAIIAACVSAGMSMDHIREFYVGSGEQMFDKASIFKRLRYSYNDEPLAMKLRAELNRTLGYADGAPPASFGDGGVTTYNNPAFLGFQLATATSYKVNRATGADKPIIVSVGTGGAANARPGLDALGGLRAPTITFLPLA